MPTKILINIPMVTLVVDVATRHLSWQVYLSSIQASLTSDNYPTHYGCKCILLPIIFKWSQPRLIIMETSREAEYIEWFLTFAFGNRIALTVDSVNIRATCTSALPTRSRSSRGPLMSYKNNLKIFQRGIFGVMAYRHLVSLYLLTHLSKLRFVIISTDTISAIAAITHQIVFKCSTNCF